LKTEIDLHLVTVAILMVVFFFVGKPTIRQGGKEASGREAATVPGISGKVGEHGKMW
jgi:hypothetical protein